MSLVADLPLHKLFPFNSRVTWLHWFNQWLNVEIPFTNFSANSSNFCEMNRLINEYSREFIRSCVDWVAPVRLRVRHLIAWMNPRNNETTGDSIQSKTPKDFSFSSPFLFRWMCQCPTIYQHSSEWHLKWIFHSTSFQRNVYHQTENQLCIERK